MVGKRGLRQKTKLQGKAKVQENVAHLRVLAHDLSNALEAILQASYLLSHGKLETESKRWAQLIESSSEEAARINREMRKLMRSLGEE
jgi:nitrogen-specific signal transduction histidine kinase